MGAGQSERAAIVHFLRGEHARIFRQQRAVALASLREAEALAGLTALPDEGAMVRALAADNATTAAVAGEQEARRQSAAWRDKFETLQHEARPSPGETTPHPFHPHLPPLTASTAPTSLLSCSARPRSPPPSPAPEPCPRARPLRRAPSAL